MLRLGIFLLAPVIQRIWFYLENKNLIFEKHVFFISLVAESSVLFAIFIAGRLVHQKIRFVFLCLWQMIFILLIADHAYFRESNKHIDFELTLLGDEIAWYLVRESLTTHWDLLAILLGVSVVAWIARPTDWQLIKAYFCNVPVLVLVSAGMVVPVLSDGPIFTENPAYGISTGLLRKSIPLATRSISRRNDILDPNSEIYVQQNGREERKVIRHYNGQNGLQKNLIVIILEGWSQKYVGTHIHKIGVTPNTSRLLEKSTVFTNAHATGARTVGGLKSILLGVPDLPRSEITLKIPAAAQSSSLPGYLKQIGYRTIFMTATSLGVADSDKDLAQWGFDEVHLVKPKNTQVPQKTLQAVCPSDNVVYSAMVKRFSESAQQPFFAVVLTSMTHFPYAPSEDESLFPENLQDRRYLGSLRAADRELGQFIAGISKLSVSRQTVFLIIADHTHHKNLDFVQDRRIPFFIFDAANANKRHIDKPVSQIDVLPTVLFLSGFDHTFFAFGKNALGNATSPSYYAFGGQFGWVTEDLIFRKSIHALLNSGLYHHSDGQLSKNLCLADEYAKKCEEFSRAADHMLTDSYQILYMP